jgi:16S rRNA (guanine(527)-N(7))-methyltransferase RsmG
MHLLLSQRMEGITMKNDLRVTAWLEEAGIAFDDGARERLEALCACVRRFNPQFSLVSRGDLSLLWDRHVIDSLSLAPLAAPWMDECGLNDIGSGAGFPGLVLAAVFPAFPVRLVERSESKVDFLHNAVVAMGLESVTIDCGDFPRAASLEDAGVVTARAVEKGSVVAEAILKRLPEGSLYLCQNEAGASADPHLFHVEHIEDRWAKAELRRGCLYAITRKGAA